MYVLVKLERFYGDDQPARSAARLRSLAPQLQPRPTARGPRPADPASWYEPSRRPPPVPSWGRDFTYPEGCEAVRPDRHGVVRWRGHSPLRKIRLGPVDRGRIGSSACATTGEAGGLRPRTPARVRDKNNSPEQECHACSGL